MAETAPGAPLWTARDIAAATEGLLTGRAFAAHGVAIDSRELEAGDLFVALTAARDGHEFVAQALGRGAAGSLVSIPSPEPCILVGDTLEALGRLARAARRRAPGARRGAVTGSVGKTSVTQAVLAGLTRAGGAHGSVKSFNNHIGVPLTLARMPPDTRRAIFEIGMNHAGEIAPLSRLVRPHAVAITTVEAVHVENFPDGEAGVAAAKAEILAGLEPGGAAILNADNGWFDHLAAEARASGARVLAFGQGADCAARLTGFQPGPEGARVEAVIEGRRLAFPIRQTARHWGPMSLAAILMLRALEVDMETALAALEAFEPLEGRGAERTVPLGEGAFILIDESYNASPVSVAAALRGLGARTAAGRTIAALTDMLELGADSADRHAALAPVIAEAGIDLVFCAGPLMKTLYEALEPTRRGAWASTAGALIPRLLEAVSPGDVVMVKGSKASKASEISAALAAASVGELLMLYLLYQRLAEHQHYIPILNLLRYETFRGAMAVATSQLVVVAMGSRFIRWMRAKQGRGQPIRTDGIQRHITEKAGTPTMGGLMFLAGITVATLLWADLGNIYVWVVLMVTLSFGALGFMDDYAKVTKQTTAGISGRVRLLAESLIAVLAVFLMVTFAQHAPEGASLSTSVVFPIFKRALVDLSWFYLIFGAFIIVGASNAVNFTDGLDGLATVPVMIAAATFGLIAYMVGNFRFSDYLELHFVPGAGEVAILCAAIVGSGLGFLWYNAPPARIFMGDSGALSLGGALGTIAVATKHEIVLGIVGGLFVIETVSVIIQVLWFKRTGRRVFLMAPIHHHFERLGWSEATVVIRFWIVAIMLALLGLSTLKLR